MTERLLKEADVARFLNLSVATMQAWRMRRIGPPFVVLSRKAVRYRPSELLELVKAHEVEPEKRAVAK